MSMSFNLLLDGRQTPETRPGSRSESGSRLGWNSWLPGQRDTPVRDEVCFVVSD